MDQRVRAQPDAHVTDTPQANWNRRRYADSSGTVQVEAYSIQGAGHSLPMSGMAAAAIAVLRPHRRPPTADPPSTPTRSTPPSPRPRRRGAGSRYTPNAWNTGLTANITITNTGTTAVNGWTLTLTWPGNQQITNAWNATVTQSGAQVTARNVPYNATIAPGAAVTLRLPGHPQRHQPRPHAIRPQRHRRAPCHLVPYV